MINIRYLFFRKEMYAVRSGVHQSRKSPDHTTPVLTFHHARRYSSLILSKVQRQALFQRIPVFYIGNILTVHQMPVVKCCNCLRIFTQGMPVNVPEAFRLLYKAARFAQDHDYTVASFANARIIGTESDNPPSKYV